MQRKRTIRMPDGREVEVDEISFQTAGEHWNEYILDDGSRLRMKLVVTDVVRIPNAFDAQGNPQYLVNHQQIISVAAPEHLRQKPGEGTS